MGTQLVEALMAGARDRLTADGIRVDESRVADTDRAGDGLPTVRADSDEGADDSAIVVILDGDEIVGYDDGALKGRRDNEDSGGGGWGDGGDYDDGAPLRAPVPQPELSEERRDRVILMMAVALATGTALLIGGIMLAGALGWMQPACGGVLVTHTATCQTASGLYTTLKPAITPDWSRYRLDAPAGQQQPTP